jgi:hypothetical protein
VQRLAAFVGLLALLAASAAGAEVPLGVAISDLTGLDPPAVRSRLADVPSEWPIPPAFQVAGSNGLLTFITADALMTDPILAQQLAVFRTQGDPAPAQPFLACTQILIRNGRAAEAASSVVLMFRNGRLDAAFQPIAPAIPPAPDYRDRKASLAYIRRPVSSPFVAHFGELPLEDGLGFLSRWEKTPLAPNDRLSATCSPWRPPPQPPSHAHEALNASDMQGLALLPFAISLPGMNRQRVAARRDGAALLASLHIGDPLSAPPRTFAAAHTGVRAYPAKGSDYAVLTIDLGGYPSRNLSNFKDAALLGVRDGRIEWVSPPSYFGPKGGLLCLDERGVPNTPRRGCTGWGQFSP